MADVSFKFDMYDKVKDRISGYKGVIVAMYYYHTGCKHYGVAPDKVSKDGKIGDWENLDESRLILISKSKVEKKEPVGGVSTDRPEIQYGR